METVAANMVVLVELIRNSIEESMFGHGAMEGIIEHNHLRRGGHKGIYGSDTTKMASVVHRGKVAKFFNTLFHFGRNDTAIVILVATLHDAMTHGVNLLEVANGANLFIEQHLEHEVHTLLVVGHVVHNHFFLAVWQC